MYNNAESGLITPQVATMSFSWNIGERTIEKKVGGFFIGPSVEGLMAIGMVRGYAQSAATNVAVIEGAEIEPRMYKSPDSRSIITFYPIFKRVLVSSTVATSTPSGARPMPRPMPAPNGDDGAAAEAIVNGPIRLVSAMANPEGDEAGREKVSLRTCLE